MLSFVALYTAVFLLMTGIGLLGTYLPLRLTLEAVSAQMVGFVMSAYYLGMIVGAFQCHRLIKSVGHIRAFAAFAALTTAIVMLHGIYISPLFWGVLRFFCGISTIGLYMVIESWLNECAEPSSRGRVLSIYMVMSFLGMGVGQQLLNLGEKQNMQMFYLVGLMVALCLVPVAVTRSIHPQLPKFERFNAIKLFRRAPTGMLGCLSSGMLNGAFYSIGPVFCHQIGLSVSQLSLVMTVTIMGGLVLQWPVGTLSDRFDRTYVLAFLGLTIAILSIIILLLAEKSYSAFLVLMVVFGGLIFTLYPVSVARAHDVFNPEDIVPVSSVLLLSYGIGAAIGPVLATTTMSLMHSGYGLYAYFSVVALLYGVITFLLRHREFITVVPAEDNSEFVIIKNTSPMAAVIDPRVELGDKEVDGDK
jgi:MFS family permease